MSKLFPFFFKFGVSFDYYTIPQEIINRICKYLSKKYKTIDIEYIIGENVTTIGISDEDASTNSIILAERLSTKISEYCIDDFNESIFFIYAESAYSDKFYEPLFNKIKELIKEEKIEKQTHPVFYILLNSIVRGDMVYNYLYKEHINNDFLDFCFAFDLRGNYVSTANSKIGIYNDSNLYKLVIDISTPHIDIFRSKLIRKINHFKIIEEDKHSLCQLYYYEINDTDHTTLYNLLLHRLVDIYKTGFEFNYIVYYCPKHSWLPESIISLSDYLKSMNMKELISNYKSSFNLWDDGNRKFEEFKNEITSKNKKGVKILFISDIINTGTTFKKVINKLNKIPKLHLYCISLLATDHATRNFKAKGKNLLVIDDQKVGYFHEVIQQHYLKIRSTENCPICNFGIIPSADVTERIDKDITALEMWQMCSESGFKFEDFVPEWRSTDKRFIIPDSIRLFQQNSPLLAYKFESKLKDAGIYSREVVIIYPDERKTINDPIESTPSGFFVKCLNLYNSNYNYLGIPRHIINDARSGNIDYNNTNTYINHDIIDEINKIDVPIVIIDEVNISTRTIVTIYDLLTSCHKYPQCYFPIFNFNVKETNAFNEKLGNGTLKFLSLYEFNLK